MDVLAHPNINANNPKLIISCVLHYGEIHCNTESNVIEKHKKIFSRCVCSPPLRNPSLSSSPLLFSCHITGTVAVTTTKIRNRSPVNNAQPIVLFSCHVTETATTATTKTRARLRTWTPTQRHCAFLLSHHRNHGNNNNKNKGQIEAMNATLAPSCSSPATSPKSQQQQ